MSEQSIVLLAGPDESTRMVYHALQREFNVTKVIIEQPVSRMTFIRRRLKRLGFWQTFGQVLFRLLAFPALGLAANRRMAEIRKEFNLNDDPIDEAHVAHVESANAPEVASLLQECQPAAVVLNGTRIISKDILNCIEAPFINMHAGITPNYRGVHGGYWALVENDRQNCGVTVHFVDAGIDTGGIIAQAAIEPAPEDNFTTYPLLQVGVGLPLLLKALSDLAEDKTQTLPLSDAPSKLWSHPTLWGYLWRRMRRGVK